MTTLTHYLAESAITGEEFYGVLQALEPILSSVEKRVAVAACLGAALTIQEPDMTLKEVYDGIRGSSEWMCLFLSTIESAKAAGGGEPAMLN